MLLLAAVGLITLAFLYYYLRGVQNIPPGPLGLPIVGYLPWLDAAQPHISFTNLASKYGPIYSLQMGRVFTVVLSDVKLIRQAFSMEEFSGRAPLHLTHGIMKGNGIICVQGEKWREQRKFVVNSLKNLGMVKFGPKRDKMERNIMEGVKEVLDKLNENGNDVNTEALLMHSLGNVVFKLVFGKRWQEDDDTWKTLQHLQEEGTRLIGVAGPLNFLPFLRFLPAFQKSVKFIENGIIFTHGIYQSILAEYVASNESDDHLMGAFYKEVEDGQEDAGHFTMTQFNFLMADIFGAGADTTLATLRWFYLYMALNQQAQEKTYRELLEVVGTHREVCLADTTALPYLEACIAEVQRIRSVTPVGIPHGTLKEVTLGGYTIPARSMVIPLQWAIHMDPGTHPEPDKFNPARFLDHSGRFKKPDNFIPFQTGKRMCLGEEYAKMLLFLFAAPILHKFNITCTETDIETVLQGDTGITLTPKRHLLHFLPRNLDIPTS